MSDGFIFDTSGALIISGVVIRDTDAVSATATDHPIEDGSTVTDHIQPQPDTLTLTVGVSDAPVTGEARPGLTLEVFEALRALVRSRQLVTVSTSQGLYLSYVILTAERPRDARSGNGAEIPISLRQVRITRSSTVSVPPEILAATVRASGKGKDKTQQSDKEATAKEAKAGKDSLLRGLVKAARGGGGDA